MLSILLTCADAAGSGFASSPDPAGALSRTAAPRWSLPLGGPHRRDVTRPPFQSTPYHSADVNCRASSSVVLLLPSVRVLPACPAPGGERGSPADVGDPAGHRRVRVYANGVPVVAVVVGVAGVHHDGASDRTGRRYWCWFRRNRGRGLECTTGGADRGTVVSPAWQEERRSQRHRCSSCPSRPACTDPQSLNSPTIFLAMYRGSIARTPCLMKHLIVLRALPGCLV